MASWIGYEPLTKRRETKELNFSFAVDASGVATVSAYSSGVTVTKQNTGIYDCFLAEPYVALIGCFVQVCTDTADATVESFPAVHIAGTNVTTATAASRKVEIRFHADNSGAWALADPVSRTVFVKLVLANSNS